VDRSAKPIWPKEGQPQALFAGLALWTVAEESVFWFFGYVFSASQNLEAGVQQGSLFPDP
jgi:hypothetical protein